MYFQNTKFSASRFLGKNSQKMISPKKSAKMIEEDWERQLLHFSVHLTEQYYNKIKTLLKEFL